MNGTSFFDGYKTAEWQKLRLRCLESAKWTCQCCGLKAEGETMLHVHHKAYVKGLEVWQYHPDELAVLCEGCHAYAHDQKDTLQQALLKCDPIYFTATFAMLAQAIIEGHQVDLTARLLMSIHAYQSDAEFVNKLNIAIDEFHQRRMGVQQ